MAVLLLTIPYHSLKNQRPGKTKVENEVNEHRYWQATHRAESIGSHNTKRSGMLKSLNLILFLV